MLVELQSEQLCPASAMHSFPHVPDTTCVTSHDWPMWAPKLRATNAKSIFVPIVWNKLAVRRPS